MEPQSWAAFLVLWSPTPSQKTKPQWSTLQVDTEAMKAKDKEPRAALDAIEVSQFKHLEGDNGVLQQWHEKVDRKPPGPGSRSRPRRGIFALP